MRRNSLWWLVPTLLVLSGLLLLVKLPDYEWGRAVGDALVIAGILALTADRLIKERFLREVSRDVSKYLIGYDLPKEIQDKIHELMGTALVRLNCQLKYSLSRGPEGYVGLVAEFTYEVKNFSSQVQEYSQYVAFEKHEEPTIHELRCDSSDKGASYSRKGEELTLREKEGEPGVLELRGRKTKLRPVREGVTYEFAMKYSRRVREEDSEVFAFAGPTIGAIVRAQVPPDLDFVAPPATLETENRWDYRRVFLEGQHLHVRWVKKKPPGAR